MRPTPAATGRPRAGDRFDSLKDAAVLSKIHLRGWGVFDDFRWPDELVPLRSKAIIYGWNYSGKTTLSRAVRAMERGQQRHDDFPVAETVVEQADGPDLRLSSGDAIDGLAVFNADYIAANLGFAEGRAVPVLLVGEDEQDREEQLVAARTQRDDAAAEIVRARAAKAAIEARVDADCRRVATEARDRYRRNPYDIRRVKRAIEAVREGREERVRLTPEEFARHDAIATTFDLLPAHRELPARPGVTPEVRDRIDELLRTQVEVAEVIDDLRDNPALAAWARAGRPLHEGRGTCAFCGGPWDDAARERLRQHFSRELEALGESVDEEVAALRRLRAGAIEAPAVDTLYEDIRAEYGAALDRLRRSGTDRDAEIDQCVAVLRGKAGRAFDEVEPFEWGEEQDAFAACIAEVNGVLQRHNERTESFEAERQAAFGLIERDKAIKLLEEHRYVKQLDEAEAERVRCAAAVQSKQEAERRISELEAGAGDAGRGAAAINEVLERIFAGGGIRVTPADTHGFEIQRGGRQASCLSEGEQTAIAFAHFLASIDDGAVAIQDRIVWIDDPISSLDAQHVYAIYSLIRDRLGDVGQLVVSTHNFDFFSLIRDWMLGPDDEGGMGRGFGNRPQAEWGRARTPLWSAHAVRRSGEAESVIESLPDELQRWRSEYHYLFSLVYRVAEGRDAETLPLLLLPNVARRFFEMFGGIARPTSEQLRARTRRLIADEDERLRFYKFVQDHSHGRGARGPVEMPTMEECRAVMRTCVEAVRAWNPDHYGLLVAEIDLPD